MKSQWHHPIRSIHVRHVWLYSFLSICLRFPILIVKNHHTEWICLQNRKSLGSFSFTTELQAPEQHREATRGKKGNSQHKGRYHEAQWPWCAPQHTLCAEVRWFHVHTAFLQLNWVGQRGPHRTAHLSVCPPSNMDIENNPRFLPKDPLEKRLLFQGEWI